MVPFVLMVCALTCAVASYIHGHGFDGLALAAILFIILAGVLKYATEHAQKADGK